MIISHLVSDQPPTPAGYHCSGVDGGLSSSTLGERKDELWTRESIGDGQVEIVVGSRDEVTARKTYDRSFVQSGKSDRFTASAPNGDLWTWFIWSGDECVPCPPGPYEPMPGDASGCGY
jgi:hypothetical protein